MSRELNENQIQLAEDFGKGPFDKLLDLEKLLGGGALASFAERYDDDLGSFVAKLAMQHVPDQYLNDVEAFFKAMVTGETEDLENALSETLDEFVNIESLDDTVEEILSRALVKVLISFAKKLRNDQEG